MIDLTRSSCGDIRPRRSKRDSFGVSRKSIDSLCRRLCAVHVASRAFESLICCLIDFINDTLLSDRKHVGISLARCVVALNFALAFKIKRAVDQESFVHAYRITLAPIGE